MSHATHSRSSGPHSALDTDAVRAAYRRWASIYDTAFGSVSTWGRRRAVDAVNALPGERVLEVGVGTGINAALYPRDCSVTGIDLSSSMLEKARDRIARMLKNLPEARANLAAAGAELHIIGKDQVTSDLPEHRHRG